MNNIKEFVVEENTAQFKKEKIKAEINFKNNSKYNYKKWEAFKESYLNFVNFLINKGQVEHYQCRKCEVEKSVIGINIYDLMMGFSVSDLNQKTEKIEKLIVDSCKECNFLDDASNPYILNSSQIELICDECKSKINKDQKHFEILNKKLCKKECVRLFLNKKNHGC